MGDIAIKVENLSKYYHLGVINSGTLSRDLQSWLWKRMGKEDPNREIGVHEDNSDGFWALKDLNFDIKKGERVGIIGKNGAGKSTLLKMLSQISAPTEGKIYINGKIASLLEVGTGFNPELTGRENIYLNGAILGMKSREVDAKIDEIIAFSEIERHIDTPVKRYSSGMYVRLAFAVAAHLDSDILIADEVLAVGDAAFQKKALGKMNELSSGQGRTVLFVSHNMNAVKQLCQRGIVLEKGKVAIDDKITIAQKKYHEVYTKTFTVDMLTSSDETVRRGNGSLDFTDIVFSKKEYFDNEDIVIKFSVKVNKTMDGFYFSLSIKNSERDCISQIMYKLSDGIVEKDFEKTYILTIPKFSFFPGEYPLYFWLGDKLEASGITSNFRVLDELTPNLVIMPSRNENDLDPCEKYRLGYFKISSSLVSL